MEKEINVDGKNKDELIKETAEAVAEIAYQKMMNEEYEEDFVEEEEDYGDKQRYINDDLMPQKPLRKYYPMQKEMMPAIIKVFYKKLSGGSLPYNYYFDYDGGHQFLWQLINRDETILNDKEEIYAVCHYLMCDPSRSLLYYKNGFGNNAKGKPLLGLQEFGKFVFIGFEMGHVDTYPIFGIIYFDGKKLRLYYPSCGNMYNADFNACFGGESYAKDFERKYKDYIKEQLGDEDDEIYHEVKSLSDCYAEKYFLSKDSVHYGFNWDLIKQDILSAFEVDENVFDEELMKEINMEWLGAETIFGSIFKGIV